jgi:hypothetical protein
MSFQEYKERNIPGTKSYKVISGTLTYRPGTRIILFQERGFYAGNLHMECSAGSSLKLLDQAPLTFLTSTCSVLVA